MSLYYVHIAASQYKIQTSYSLASMYERSCTRVILGGLYTTSTRTSSPDVRALKSLFVGSKVSTHRGGYYTYTCIYDHVYVPQRVAVLQETVEQA